MRELGFCLDTMKNVGSIGKYQNTEEGGGKYRTGISEFCLLCEDPRIYTIKRNISASIINYKQQRIYHTVT